MATKRAAKGLVLEHGGAASGAASWATVVNHRADALPGDEADLLDATTHDSTGGRKEYVPGLIDSEDISVELVYDPGDSVHEALRAASGGVAQHFRMTLPGLSGGSGNDIHTFAGFVKGFSPRTAYDGIQMADMTIKRTGVTTVTSTA